ncbi:hypothetical protein [Fodinibius sediminis]|uniref:hypothetical protein n=1 Tax=Fodinibius sediminis TaxID=1214077 RepID=UPI00163D4871|nr:hypothetical protein [Fodinibius sediminis]
MPLFPHEREHEARKTQQSLKYVPSGQLPMKKVWLCRNYRFAFHEIPYWVETALTTDMLGFTRHPISSSYGPSADDQTF